MCFNTCFLNRILKDSNVGNPGSRLQLPTTFQVLVLDRHQLSHAHNLPGDTSIYYLAFMGEKVDG